MNQRLVEDGVYFVELLHTTVFDTIRLGNPIKITVDRVIKVKGSIISSE